MNKFWLTDFQLFLFLCCYIFIIDINSSSHTFLYGYRVTTFKASQTYLDKRLIYKVCLKSSYNKLRLGIRPKFALVTGGLYELGR